MLELFLDQQQLSTVTVCSREGNKGGLGHKDQDLHEAGCHLYSDENPYSTYK